MEGTKRGFADVDSPDTNDSRDDPSWPDETKRQRSSEKVKHKFKQSTSESSRKRARNIQRLLQRKQDLPANVVNDLERELAAHKAAFADKAFQRKRTAMIAKYHMVRFFERRKASRLVKQLRGQVEQNPESDEMDRLRQDLHIAAVDEAYTLYFPHLEPYVSLYGSTQSGEADAGEGKMTSAKVSLRAQRPPMWSLVESTIAEGPEALRRLRERRPVDGISMEKMPKHQRRKALATASNATERTPPPPQHQKPQEMEGLSRKDGAAPQLNRRERRRLMHEAKAAADNEKDEEGGGFFEDL